MIRQYLDDLERRIDPRVEEDLLSQWASFLEGKLGGGIFCPRRKQPAPSAMEWPRISVNAALDDPELMLLLQLAGCSAALAEGSGAIMTVRANYGSGILPSLFGAEEFRMDEALNTLPAARPLAGGVAEIRRLLDRGAPDLRTGLGARCLAMGRRFVDSFAGYPNVDRYVRIYHPDLQGPLDACEVLWGSGLFLSLIDEPELVHAFLALIAETYSRFMREWDRVCPPRHGYAPHWGMLHKGHIMLRDDSAMNLSPAMFDEFVAPYDRKLLAEFGGGAMHFCGRCDHYIERLHRMDGVFAVNMTQPQYNDMEHVFRNTVDKGIVLLGLSRDAARKALDLGRDLRGMVHCSW